MAGRPEGRWALICLQAHRGRKCFEAIEVISEVVFGVFGQAPYTLLYLLLSLSQPSPLQRLGSSSMQPEEGTGWLLELLSEVQLQQYFLRLRDDLNVTRLSHFEYVKNEDLEKIGMGRPGTWETSVLLIIIPVTLCHCQPLGEGVSAAVCGASQRAWPACPRGSLHLTG